jgi:integrase
MATVFKPAGADKWQINYTDEHGKRRKKIGYPDKKRSDRLAAQLEERAREIREGLSDPKAEGYRIHEGVPLTSHVVDFERYLLAKGGGAQHARTSGQRIRRVLELAKCRRISELSLSRALDAIQDLRGAGLGQESINHHIRAVKSFSRWLCRDGRAREHHLAYMATSSSESDRRHVRRLLSPEEASRIIQAAASGPDAESLRGPDRAILYLLALGTGFRRDELKTLTPERFNLDGDPPTVTGKSCYTKNRKEAVQPIAQSLADRLRPWLAGKPPGKPVFGNLTSRTARMLKVDLANAGIPYETDSGFADFHSLRGNFISYLVSSGASVKTCQTLARHSTPTLTIGIYAKASLHDINGAVENLPDLTPANPDSESLRMTGTDGIPQSHYFSGECNSEESTQVQCQQHGSDAQGSHLSLDVKSCGRGVDY